VSAKRPNNTIDFFTWPSSQYHRVSCIQILPLTLPRFPLQDQRPTISTPSHGSRPLIMTSTTSVPSPGSLPDIPDIPKILKIIQSAIDIQKPKPKIILFTKSGFNESPQGAIKRNERSDVNENNNESDERTSKKINYGPNCIAGGALDESEDKNVESAPRRTRSEHPKLRMLKTKTHHRRSKVCPQLTPWGDYGMLAEMNDLYPEQRRLKWDNSDVPEFDLGEPLDELNFWEESWIEANEEKKKVRDERERKRKR
jgi:hypothetical protein